MGDVQIALEARQEATTQVRAFEFDDEPAEIEMQISLGCGEVRQSLSVAEAQRLRDDLNVAISSVGDRDD